MEGSMRFRGFFFFMTLIVSIWGGWFFFVPQAHGDPEGGKGSETTGGDGPKKSGGDLTKRRYLRMEEIEIHGDVEKPKTMFVIPRASLRYSRKAHEKDFTSEILDPMMRHWIEDTQRWREAVPPP
jgi:hypothetical protein